MAGTMSRGELLSLVRHIGVTEQRIAAQLRHIEGQLQKLTSMKALDHPYYITFKGLLQIVWVIFSHFTEQEACTLEL